MRKIILLYMFLVASEMYGKIVTCDFEIIFKCNLEDDLDRLSFGFLVTDGIDFKDLHYTVEKNYEVTIAGQMYYEDEKYHAPDFPLLARASSS